MTDTQRNSPLETPKASPIDDTDLDQVVGGDGATTTTTTTTSSDFHITKTVDKSSPKLY